jgi:hypothetical protein
MPRYYRAYALNSQGHITGPPEIISADSDDAAIREAEALSEGRGIEVWREGRLVFRLEPSG